MKLVGKELKSFLLDESGFVKREHLIKFGVSSIGIVSMLSCYTPSILACSHTSHFDTTVPEHLGKSGDAVVKIGSAHVNGPSHAIHANNITNNGGYTVSHTNFTEAVSHTASCY